MLQVLLAFRQQDWGSTFFHSQQHVVKDLFIALFISYPQAVEFLDRYVGRWYERIKARSHGPQVDSQKDAAPADYEGRL